MQHGPQHMLKLQADLVRFLHVPGCYNGKHLAHAFIYVLNYISITLKVNASFIFHFWCSMLLKIGWITVNNASNNDTFLYYLKRLLKEWNIYFDAVLHHIQSVHIITSLISNNMTQAFGCASGTGHSHACSPCLQHRPQLARGIAPKPPFITHNLIPPPILT